MAEQQLPYVTAYGNITKALEKIQHAATPDRFTQDFLATKLGLKGGTPKPVIPFLKRIGFLGSDGVPTELYKRFRNSSEAGAAAFQALKTGYRPLFEANEYAHDLPDKDLKGLIISQTGLEGSSSTLGAILGSFKALRAFSEATEGEAEDSDTSAPAAPAVSSSSKADLGGISLGYTINLNLPATTDVAVYNAIFKSIREYLIGNS